MQAGRTLWWHADALPALGISSCQMDGRSWHLTSERKGVTLQSHGQQDAVMRTRCASPALKLPQSSELGVPTAWPGKPQLRKGTRGLAHGDNRSMGSPDSSNKLLFGACMDFLEFKHMQNTGARAAVSHFLAAVLLHLKQASVSKPAPDAGKLLSCLQTLEPQQWDVHHLCSTASLHNHYFDPFHSGRGVGSGGDKRTFPMVKAAQAMLGTEKRQG